MVSLNDDEKQIMKAVASSRQNSHTVHRLAFDLHLNEVAVELIVKSLIGKKMLFLGHPKQGGTRYLRMTDRGECYSLVHCNVDFDVLMDNHPYLESQNIVKGVRRAIDGAELRTKVVEFCTRHLIAKDLFDSNGSNVMAKGHNKWEIHSILIEWTKYVKNLSIEYPGQINLKRWAAYVHIYDENLKVDGILGTQSDNNTITIKKKA